MPHEHPQVRVSPIFPVSDLQRALDHDPLRTAPAAYLHVPDADVLAAEWAPVDRTGAPVDTDYGLREGWHIDPDGNLLRFGSPLASAR